MVRWIEKQWDAAAAFVARHPKKSAAIGLAGAWYQAIVDIANGLWSLTPTRSTLVRWWSAMSWPDWSVSWVTGPFGTLVLLLLWWQTRHGRGPFANTDLATTGQNREKRELERLDANRASDVERLAKAGSQQTELQIADQLKEVTIERDQARQAYALCKRDFAISRIRWSAHLKRERQLEVKVTVRFAVYDDYVMANQIQTIIQENTDWPVTIDGGNKPVIKPDARFKVVFVMGWAESFKDIAAAFNVGAACAGGCTRA